MYVILIYLPTGIFSKTDKFIKKGWYKNLKYETLIVFVFLVCLPIVQREKPTRNKKGWYKNLRYETLVVFVFLICLPTRTTGKTDKK